MGFINQNFIKYELSVYSLNKSRKKVANISTLFNKN